MTRPLTTRPRPQDDEELPFRPTRRFTKPKPKDTRRFKPGWLELVLDLLRSYVARTGDALVPADHREGNFRLGWMVAYLRVRQRQGALSPERVRKLESFPGWSWNPIQDQFQKGLARLKRFGTREGHSNVPPAHRELGLRLGLWVENLRARHRRGRLARDKVKALEAIPGWSWQGAFSDRRSHQVLQALRRLVARQGRFHVSRNQRALGINLYRWVVLQREAYHQGRLPRARALALEAVPGWSWRPLEDRFEEGMRRLRHYAEREGHSRVPRQYLEPDFKLGVWVMQLRQFHRKGRLSSERARRLERLPGWTWNAKSTPRRRTS